MGEEGQTRGCSPVPSHPPPLPVSGKVLSKPALPYTPGYSVRGGCGCVNSIREKSPKEGPCHAGSSPLDWAHLTYRFPASLAKVLSRAPNSGLEGKSGRGGLVLLLLHPHHP